MIKGIMRKILKLESNIDILESSILYAFIKVNGYNRDIKNVLVKNFLLNSKVSLSEKIVKLIKDNNIRFDFEVLVSIFELIIPMEEKKINGAHYTPVFIIKEILEETLDQDKLGSDSNYFICDTACGTGAFFIPTTLKIVELKKSDFYTVYKNYLYGIDISEESIKKAKILLSLLAVIHGEDREEFEFNLIVANSLSFDWEKGFPNVFLKKGGFDLVIGNPPYVRAKNIEDKVKESMSNWNSATKGNADLYIPFIELGTRILNEAGRLGYITINTFIHSSNGELLREYLLDNRLVYKICSFGDLQIFESATSYTCLLFCSKGKHDLIQFALCKSVNQLEDIKFSAISYNEFTSAPWKLLEESHINNIKKIESIGESLGKRYEIKNGIATLRNNIYIHFPINENEDYYTINYEGKEYLVEKSITKKIVKPNVIKNEIEMLEKMEILIFPYKKNTKDKYAVISDEEFKTNYPNAYNFLTVHKEILMTRDNGNREYPEWFAFGREQGINIYGKKLFMPYMAKEPIFFKCVEPEVLFYCGYCILCENEEEMDVLKKILSSRIFWYYIRNVSKDYSNGYKSFAKNYVKNFAIPNLDRNLCEKLLSTDNKNEIDSILSSIYGLSLDSLQQE
ncbi:SAM-dependent methyltransferase [Brevibacillus laterosporus]|uniref:Eco57I restriction-modification methylase domain-containing protein n=1 Tax=Brevibacillus laterosporus TaxID=1465 RepID=UPI000C76BCAD|nr:N-6 DNA methylase [Brevibacillus laterosporus]AUM63306.1 SAM-dependent methyltransferase [Brevibacillus laterosporus]